MGIGGFGRFSAVRAVIGLLFATWALLTIPAPRADGALITGNYQINWDQDVDRTDQGTTSVRKFKQTLDLKYKGLVSPVVQNEITFKFEQEIASNAPSVTRFLPTLDLAFKGKFWDAKAGGKRTHENSDDPTKNPKISDSYFVELFYLAPKRIPDLKGKYTIDSDFEEGTTDTSRQSLTLSSVYKPKDWLDLKGDYNRNESQDKLNADADTEDDKIGGTIGLRRLISDKIKVDVQYSVEKTSGATLASDGSGSVPGTDKKTRTDTVKNAISIRPFRNTAIDGSYDYDLKRDDISGEWAVTRNAQAAASQRIGPIFDVKGDFSRAISEAQHTADDNRKTEDTWTFDFKAKPSKQLDFTIKYQEKIAEEEHFVPATFARNTTITRSGSWGGEITPFWKASVSYDRTDTYLWLILQGREILSTIDTKYGVRSTFDFKAINLTLDPSYDVSVKDDRILVDETETRDFKFKIAAKVLTTRTVDAKVDHTYGRKTDSGLQNIQRTDNSSGSISWTNPLPGWTLGFDVTRAANDTSEDTDPPDITSTFGFKADYRFDRFSLGTSYKYDKKSLTDDSETFDVKAGWTAPRWDLSLTYSFNKTFSDLLNEGYSISTTFKYNL